jgi:hypothetical protein
MPSLEPRTRLLPDCRPNLVNDPYTSLFGTRIVEMIDPLFDTWTQDASRFVSQASYTVIEASSSLDGSQHHVREHRAPEQDTLTMLTTPVPLSDNCRVKVLLLDYATRRLSCSSNLFRNLHERWSLPNCVVDHLYTRRPASLLFTDPPVTKTKPRRFDVLGPSINHQCVWLYEPSHRTLFAIFSAKRDTATQLQQ